jgi:hypothetical protein
MRRGFISHSSPSLTHRQPLGNLALLFLECNQGFLPRPISRLRAIAPRHINCAFFSVALPPLI